MKATFGMTIRIFASLVVACSVVFASSAKAEVVIDNYTAGSTIFQFGPGSSSQTTNSAGILGGSRDDSVTVRDLGGDEFFGVMGFDGTWRIGQSSQDRIFGSVTYDNFTSIDLTEAGLNNKFFLGIVASDSVDPIVNAFSISVMSGAVTSTVQFDIPGNSEVPTDVLVWFDDFVGVDFTSIDSIILAYDFIASPGTDIRIGSFSASVPEPATTAWIGFGAALLIVVRRRR